MTSRTLIAASLMTLAPIAQAQVADFGDAMIVAWQDWADTQAIPATSIAVGYKGQIIARAGQGRDPSEPYALASLSKAITAACLMQVLKENDITQQRHARQQPFFSLCGSPQRAHWDVGRLL